MTEHISILILLNASPHVMQKQTQLNRYDVFNIELVFIAVKKQFLIKMVFD